MKLKNSNCDETNKLKAWWNLKTHCDKTQKLKLWWNLKIQIVMKLKNSGCDKNSKTLIVTKLKNSKWRKTQKIKSWQNSINKNVTNLKLWQNSKTKIVATLFANCDENLNYDKSQFMRRKTNLKGSWHLDNQCDVLFAVFCDSRNVFCTYMYTSGVNTLGIFTPQTCR